MTNIASKTEEKKKSPLVRTECSDKNCPFHGNLKTRGRIFKGKVIKKFHKRVVIEFQRMIYIKKYERYALSKTKIHARLPICIESEINQGDYIKVQECRPLSKIVHFVVIDKLKDAEKDISLENKKIARRKK